MKPSLSAAFLLAAIAGAGACGSRTDLDFLSRLEPPPSPDGGGNIVVLPSADGGFVIGPDGAVLGPEPNPNANAVNPPPTPHCILTSTCSDEYVPPGYGWAVGDFSIETISATCQIPPTIVQQAMHGSWVTLAPYRADVSDTPSPDPGAYDTSAPSSASHADPPTGASVGSVQAVRACLYGSAGDINCDAPSFLGISNCFTCPRKNCAVGNFLDELCQCAKNPAPIFPGGASSQ